ncbi:HAD family hydrolase [Sphingomonas sp. CGMCC 1.13654]|uniref:HAD family hydrolase n=1 Tax=Sphingomonas chungangi TaxID=2683589 RepID=A0A838LAV4_9SPHN|nr:HAD family hydrolase [Sphingomonas chungangi]MBA2935990.1 HAD family hydrolase [Sphingomonas chungangi]MVW55380.1 HAD family hydrolase [Sphingomonas chungangi]
MGIALICLDADDTLWHNEKHFGATFAAFEHIVAPFDEAGIARETLDAVQIRNLKLYGYGAKSFTLSMIEAALEVGGDRMPGDAVACILAAGRELLAHPVELLPGIEETLDALADRARLVLVTKGDLLHQETKLAASGLGERFSGIEIVSDKTADTFRRVFQRHDVTADRALMAGDSLRSDILPALSAGAFAAHVPHALPWAHEMADEPTDHPRFRKLERLAEVVEWIDSL